MRFWFRRFAFRSDWQAHLRRTSGRAAPPPKPPPSLAGDLFMITFRPFLRTMALGSPLVSGFGRHSGAVQSAPRIGSCAARAASAAVVAVALSWSPTRAAEPQPIEPEADGIFLPALLSPIVWSPTEMPITAFAGTDGQYHLQYQLLITNATTADAIITDGDVLDPR